MDNDKEGGARSIFSSFFLLAIVVFMVIFWREVSSWLNSNMNLIERSESSVEEMTGLKQ